MRNDVETGNTSRSGPESDVGWSASYNEVQTLGAVQYARHAKSAALTLRMDVTCYYDIAEYICGSLLGKDGGLLPIFVSGSV